MFDFLIPFMTTEENYLNKLTPTEKYYTEMFHERTGDEQKTYLISNGTIWNQLILF